MTNLALRKVIDGATEELKLIRIGPRVITEGLLKLERVQVICPACGEQVEATARDGQVKGYCAIAKQYVDFLIETQKEYRQDPEYRARQSAALKKLWQDPEYRAKQIAARMGKHLTAETKAKISATLISRWQG